MPKQKEYSESIQKSLKTIIDIFEKEEITVRERQIRLWKKLEYYWAGFQKLWWSEVAHDWRVYDTNAGENDDQQYYDKSVNIFRAFLESIIAAMTAQVPGVKCIPDDPDNNDDIQTAKAGNAIAELVYKHNDAPLLMIKALYTFCTQGMTAAYNYTDKDEKYGTAAVEDYKTTQEEVEQKVCPSCKTVLSGPDLDSAEESEELEKNEFDPGEDDVKLDDLFKQTDLKEGQQVCPNCQKAVDPELAKNTITVTRMVGMTNEPKSRQCIEVLGGLYVKIPNWARCQADLPYLAYCYETHYTNIFAKYDKLREKRAQIDTCSGNEWYERWGRISPEYYGELPSNTPTVRNWWLRPSAFEAITDDDDRKALYKEFPKGVKCVFINEEYAEACPEALDDHWTITYNPLSEYVHFSPMGLLLVSIQEIISDLLSLTLQTIEHGVPQTFADPSVIDFNAYRNSEVRPGDIYPAKPKSGKSLGDAFYEVKTATLSAEVAPFGEKVQELGQFVVGAMPSLFGGNQENSSRTASQYAMSRAQSLQRLQTPWKVFTFWWKNVFGKVIPAYMKNMLEDEYLTKESSPNNFIKVAIEKAKTTGKIGSVELEAAEELPMTSAQTKDVIMQLLGLQNPEVMKALSIPQNFPLLAKAIGLNDFVLPGEDDREKQLEEIAILLQAAPVDTGQANPDGSPGLESSLQPEIFVDDHGIESLICRQFLVSEAGRQAKVTNPNGYKNVLLHLRAHMEAMQQLSALNGLPPSPDNNSNNSKGAPNAPKAPQKPVMGPTTSEENNNGGTGQQS